jgi:hypothetical protein
MRGRALSLVVAAGLILMITRRKPLHAVVFLAVAAVLIFCSIFELTKIFRDIRERKPENALRSFLEVVLLGDDNDRFKYKSPAYAYSSLCRMLPDILCPGERVFLSYLEGFRDFVKMKIYDDYDSVFLADFPVNYHTKPAFKSIEATETKRISENAAFFKAQICFEYSAISKAEAKKRGTAAKAQVYSRFAVTFDVLMIQSDGFWFIADPMTEYTNPNASAADKELKLNSN